MAPAMSRQQRRAAEKVGQDYYERFGLPARGHSMPLVLHTRALIRILARRDNMVRASAAADASYASFERSIRHQPQEPPPQCQRGCAFCCHDIVAATAPEVFRIARQVRAQAAADLAPVMQRVRTAHEATVGASPEARMRDRRPCAMLAANACTAYAVRPLVCRAANSASAAACEAAFHDGVTRVPAASLPFVLRDAHLLCLLAALRAVRLDHRSYELNHALWLALSLADAEARWLDGEDLFASVQSAPHGGSAQTALVEALLSEVSGAARS